MLVQELRRVWAHICTIQGRVLGCMQFGVLVQAVWGAGAGAEDGVGAYLQDSGQGARVHAVWGPEDGAAHICKIQGRVLGCMQFGVLVQVLRTVRAHICKIQGRVLGCMQFGVLV